MLEIIDFLSTNHSSMNSLNKSVEEVIFVVVVVVMEKEMNDGDDDDDKSVFDEDL